MTTVVDAICPVLHRSGDFGGGFDPSGMGSKPERNYSGGGNP